VSLEKVKNKEAKMQRLKEDLVKYSKQIGIVDCEIPELVFYGEEFKTKDCIHYARHGTSPGNLGGRHTGMLGIASYYTRLIFVNIRGRNQTLRELRQTLVHELVHYRFHYMSHGKEFEKRIRLILQGKPYPRKHLTYPQKPFI
jgi:hypothetical protein